MTSTLDFFCEEADVEQVGMTITREKRKEDQKEPSLEYPEKNKWKKTREALN